MKSRVKEIAKISCMVILLLSALSFCTQKRSATFNDPILSGFYPDPSIVKVKEDFYMVNSTFSYFPGIPVFHSRDLVHWSQIGNAMDRPEQMNLEGCQVSEGIFAPAIRFSNGLYYITCTLVKNGTKNFIITAENPAGPWSDPIFFPSVQGIDPSLFFDANGKGYLIWNSEPPNGEPMYSGHRTIKLIEIDLDNMMVIGDEKIIVNGGTDISKKPVWIEGPHIFQENDFYYLIAAEGGTSIDHSEVVFRSTDVFGPYESYFDNPILTQRGLDPKRINPVSSTGHADFVKLDDGTWWGVFLGCRPYDQEDHYNTGRETFLAPVKWQDEWPSFDLGGKEVGYRYPTPHLPIDSGTFSQGNFTTIFDFTTEFLGFEWLYLRTPDAPLKTNQEGLHLPLKSHDVLSNGSPSFMAHRQRHLKSSAATKLDFTPVGEEEQAGLMIFQNEKYFYYLCQSKSGADEVVQLLKSEGELMVVLEELKLADSADIELKIEADGEYYSFYYRDGSKNSWITVKDHVDARYLSTKEAGGFVGAMYAMYATSSKEDSKSTAFYKSFTYQGEDSIFKNK